MEFIERWVEKVYPSKEAFIKKLQAKKKLVIYHGIDPTAPYLHLGHSTNFLLLRKLQELGHKIILLVGDFTAQIGDPTGKEAARKTLTDQEIKKNYKSYKKQIAKILDFNSKSNPIELRFNSHWLNKLTSKEIIKLASCFTHGQMIKRSMFQKRLKENKEIYLHEFLYPLFQGYDSVAMNIDGEVGGNDQLFNMLVGRDLLKIYRNKDKFVITTRLLINPKTGRKLMSKTESFIALDLPAKEMYGAVMALPDEVISDCFRLCTISDLNKIEGLKPREAKAALSRTLVEMYYGEKNSMSAEREFNKIFQEGGLPSEIPSIHFKEKTVNISDLIVKANLSVSKAEAKRLVEQGGVKIDGQRQNNWKKEVAIKKGTVIQVGKRRFTKIS